MDALVVGGGLAGPAAAIVLARGGMAVRLWERERHPHHKVCGEFMGAEGQRLLAFLGVDMAALGAAPIDRLRLVAAGTTATARLGFVARSLSRHRLDAALLEAAAAAGVAVERGVTARSVDADGRVRSTHGEVRPPHLLLATGKQELRGARRPPAGTMREQLGFKAVFRLAPDQRAELAGHVELLLWPGGYAGLQPVERDGANLCFLVEPERWRAADGGFAALVAGLMRDVPHLARRLAGAVPLLDRPLAIAQVPYGYVHRPTASDPPWWRLGDQAAVIPSFTGAGMGLALGSGFLAARALLAGEPQPAWQARWARIAARPVGRAALVQARLGGGRGSGLARLMSLAPWAVPLAAQALRWRGI